MATTDTTTIEISVKNWQWLNALKQPGESFNDVLSRLRDQHDDEATPEPTAETSAETDSAEVPPNLDIPGSGDKKKRRLDEIARLYRFLQQEGTATKADFLELVDADSTGYASAESFWSNCVKGRDTLSVLEGVEPPAEGEHQWRYSGR